MAWITKYWKWLLLIVAILLIAWGVWGRADRKLFKLLAAQYQQEEELAITNRDEELAKLDKEKSDVQAQLAQVQKDKQTYMQKYLDSQRRVSDLEKKIIEIISPADPNALVDDLHKLGYGSATRSKSPGAR